MVALGGVGLALGCGKGEQGGKRRKAIRKPLCEPLAISEEMKKKELPNATTVYYLGKPVPIILFEEKENRITIEKHIQINSAQVMAQESPVTARGRFFRNEGCFIRPEVANYTSLMIPHLKNLSNYAIHVFEPRGSITCIEDSKFGYKLRIWKYIRETTNTYYLQPITIPLIDIEEIRGIDPWKEKRAEDEINLIHLRRHRVVIRDEMLIKGRGRIEVEEKRLATEFPSINQIKQNYDNVEIKLIPHTECDEPIVYEWVEDLVFLITDLQKRKIKYNRNSRLEVGETIYYGKKYLIRVNEKGVNITELDKELRYKQMYR